MHLKWERSVVGIDWIGFISGQKRQLTFSRKRKYPRFHSNRPSSSNTLRNVRHLFHLRLYSERQQPLSEFRLHFSAVRTRLSKIWAEEASSAQSAEKRKVCMKEILPKLRANWVGASVANLHKPKSPAEEEYLYLSLSENLEIGRFNLHLPGSAFYSRPLFCHKSSPTM